MNRTSKHQITGNSSPRKGASMCKPFQTARPSKSSYFISQSRYQQDYEKYNSNSKEGSFASDYSYNLVTKWLFQAGGSLRSFFGKAASQVNTSNCFSTKCACANTYVHILRQQRKQKKHQRPPLPQ